MTGWRWVPKVVAMTYCVTVLAACREDRAAWRADLAARGAERLVGLWTVELTLDRAAIDSLPRPTARGQIALTLNEERLPGLDSDAPPMYFGTYDIAFEPLGPGAASPGGMPTVVGVLRQGDSLELRLAPELPRQVELNGILRADSVVGRWRASEPRGIDAAGSFVMRRR